jgi:hypothetical protein
VEIQPLHEIGPGWVSLSAGKLQQPADPLARLPYSEQLEDLFLFVINLYKRPCLSPLDRMVPAKLTLLTDAVETPQAASMSWDAASFRDWVAPVCAGRSLVVLANREPVLSDETSAGDGSPSSELVTRWNR